MYDVRRPEFHAASKFADAASRAEHPRPTLPKRPDFPLAAARPKLPILPQTNRAPDKLQSRKGAKAVRRKASEESHLLADGSLVLWCHGGQSRVDQITTTIF